jgi:hypothetical protein
MDLEHLEEIQSAFASCGAEEYMNIDGNTRVADVLDDSASMVQLFERLKIPVNHYISGGGLNQEGIERIMTIGELNEDSRRAKELINSKDLYGMVTALDLDRVIGYERITGIK